MKNEKTKFAMFLDLKRAFETKNTRSIVYLLISCKQLVSSLQCLSGLGRTCPERPNV